MRVDMGEPILEADTIPTTLPGDPPINASLSADGQNVRVTCVSMGNPHCVTFVGSPTDALVLGLGPHIEKHPAFPRRINVEFVRVNRPDDVTMRVWERGSGETLACGTGACAVCVAGVLTGRTGRQLTAHLPGGDLQLSLVGNRQSRVSDRPGGGSFQRRLAGLSVCRPRELLLHTHKGFVMVPPLSRPFVPMDEPQDALPVLGKAVRFLLALIAAGLVMVFVIAIRLNPYYADGTPRSMETHRELGLPPCSFYEHTGLPCPSCGMTTSFSLLMHGDIGNSLRANAVGTGLALFCLLLIPWCVVSAWLGRPLGIWSIELSLIRVLIVFLVVLFVRWGIILGLIW